jgi:glycogen debranching enzyme
MRIVAGPPPSARDGGDIDPLHPHQLVVHDGYTYLLAAADGSIGAEPTEGLFDFDTRLLSFLRFTLAGRALDGVATPTPFGDGWRAVLMTKLEDGSPEGPRLPQDALELATRGHVGLGMAGTVVVTNHSMVEREADLRVEIGADFRDLFEIGKERRQTGRIEADWDAAACALTWHYTVEHEGRRLDRGARLRILRSDLTPSVTRVRDDVPDDEARYRLELPLRLAPKGRHELVFAIDSLVDREWRMAVDEVGDLVREREARTRRREADRAERAVVEGTRSTVPGLVEQAADDLIGLRNWDLERPGAGWIVNAGVPQFTGYFGRDSLAAGTQAAMLGTAILRGALLRAAETQGRQNVPFMEEEPGRIVHEMRRGPLSELGIRPHARYYGSHTGPAAFVFALSEHWHWTGDLELVERLRPNAERAMEWAAHFGDLNGDGILEYQQRSRDGLKNQGWKDSAEAIRYPDGRLVDNPVATVEEQAFHYLALQRLAELLVALGDEPAADAYLGAARRVRELIENRYWLEDEGTYALALDGSGEPVRTIASNPLHLLASGAISPERARRTADRLLRPDLFTGWGIRTLSSDHPSYNPFAYHLGAVWPVESALLANGAKRYGLDDHVETIVTGLVSAAAHAHRGRLPEVLGGHDRAATEVPTTYPGAKSPQAWSSSATIFSVQTLVGLEPFAAAHLLGLIRPRLPEWLPDLTIRRLRVGEASVDLRFRRRDDGATEHEVLETRGNLRVAQVAPPNDEPRGVVEHLARVAARVAPGATGRAGRIAMGMET